MDRQATIGGDSPLLVLNVDGMIEVKRAVAAIHVAKEILFRYLGEITERFFVLEFKGENTVWLRIDGKSHRRKYGRSKKCDDLPRHIDGVRLALSFGNYC